MAGDHRKALQKQPPAAGQGLDADVLDVEQPIKDLRKALSWHGEAKAPLPYRAPDGEVQVKIPDTEAVSHGADKTRKRPGIKICDYTFDGNVESSFSGARDSRDDPGVGSFSPPVPPESIVETRETIKRDAELYMVSAEEFDGRFVKERAVGEKMDSDSLPAKSPDCLAFPNAHHHEAEHGRSDKRFSPEELHAPLGGRNPSRRMSEDIKCFVERV